jgi:hypothetical protein
MMNMEVTIMLTQDEIKMSPAVGFYLSSYQQGMAKYNCFIIVHEIGSVSTQMWGNPGGRSTANYIASMFTNRAISRSDPWIARSTTIGKLMSHLRLHDESEGSALVADMAARAHLHPSYCEVLDAWLENGATILLREAVEPFGECLASGDFSDLVNVLDAAGSVVIRPSEADDNNLSDEALPGPKGM